jgi:hypothetical protein
MPCPLCLLGFPDPHTKEDWKRLAEDEELQKRLEELLDDSLNTDDYWMG